MLDLKSMLDLSKNYVPYYHLDSISNDDEFQGYFNLACVVSFEHYSEVDKDYLIFRDSKGMAYVVLVSDVRDSNFSFFADM